MARKLDVFRADVDDPGHAEAIGEHSVKGCEGRGSQGSEDGGAGGETIPVELDFGRVGASQCDVERVLAWVERFLALHVVGHHAEAAGGFDLAPGHGIRKGWISHLVDVAVGRDKGLAVEYLLIKAEC
jgi:hypothetical protein